MTRTEEVKRNLRGLWKEEQDSRALYDIDVTLAMMYDLMRDVAEKRNMCSDWQRRKMQEEEADNDQKR